MILLIDRPNNYNNNEIKIGITLEYLIKIKYIQEHSAYNTHTCYHILVYLHNHYHKNCLSHNLPCFQQSCACTTTLQSQSRQSSAKTTLHMRKPVRNITNNKCCSNYFNFKNTTLLVLAEK